MQLSNTLLKTGLVESAEIKLFGNNGYGKISGDTDMMYQFTDRFNRALDRFNFLAITADGRWQMDDSNYTDQSIATTNLVSAQREYEFNSDQLEIEAVLVKNSSGTWITLSPIDQRDPESKAYLENNSGRTGTPTKYDKRGNTLWLDVTPNYNSTSGLKVFFKRGPSYFTYSDTTKSPGIPSTFHPYIVNHASTYYGLDRDLKQAKDWYILLKEEEKSIQTFYSSRSKDEKPRMRPAYQNNR